MSQQLEPRREKGKIWRHIRKKWLAETPEETVRQEFLCVLVNEYGFALAQMDEELEVTGRGSGQLQGTMTAFKATEGLLVAWGGFKSSVYKVEAQNFFSVRLWTQKELIEALFTHYDKLDEDIRAELPLKRIWTVTVPEE